MLSDITKSYTYEQVVALIVSKDKSQQRLGFDAIEHAQEQFHAGAMMSRVDMKLVLYFIRQYGKNGAAHQAKLKKYLS